MTSRKKITAIIKAAKKYDCAVFLKTGEHPPGIMIAEAQAEEELKDWVGSVKVGLYIHSPVQLFHSSFLHLFNEYTLHFRLVIA